MGAKTVLHNAKGLQRSGLLKGSGGPLSRVPPRQISCSGTPKLLADFVQRRAKAGNVHMCRAAGTTAGRSRGPSLPPPLPTNLSRSRAAAPQNCKCPQPLCTAGHLAAPAPSAERRGTRKYAGVPEPVLCVLFGWPTTVVPAPYDTKSVRRGSRTAWQRGLQGRAYVACKGVALTYAKVPGMPTASFRERCVQDITLQQEQQGALM
jgi:hypothetical protein